MILDQKTLSFIKALFRDYYFKASVELPYDYTLREFAIQPLDSDTYIRHVAVDSVETFRKFIIDKIPRHVYYSSARYANPSNTDMKEKGWLGSDLVFDIDADHIPGCSCIEFRFCPQCGFIAEQETVKNCPRCGSQLQKFDHVSNDCIELAKTHVVKLIDVLRCDLGLRNIEISFSGHRGFHVVVPLKGRYSQLDSEARRAIVEYLKLSGVDVAAYRPELVKVRRKKVLKLPPRIVDGGIRRRIAKMLLEKVQDPELKLFIEGRLGGLRLRGIVDKMSVLESLFNEISVEDIAIVVDEKVTMDISRLIRLKYTINGKAGLIVHPLSANTIEDFEVVEDLSPFHDMKIKVRFVVAIPEITLFGERFKASKDEVRELDGAKAMYFMLKGVAKYVKEAR